MSARRILIGAHCFADAEPAIRLAVDLAQDIGAALHGVFAEDETMLALSHRMMLVAAHGPQRIASRPAMERACLDDAKAFRKELAVAARTARIDWGFETGRGSLSALFGATARRGDLLLYGYRPAFAARTCIIVIADGAQGTEGMIEVSAALAERFRKPLHVIAVGGAPPSIPAAASAEKVAALEDACDALQKRSPVAVVIALDPAAKIDLSETLDAARAPLILASS